MKDVEDADFVLSDLIDDDVRSSGNRSFSGAGDKAVTTYLRETFQQGHLSFDSVKKSVGITRAVDRAAFGNRYQVEAGWSLPN